MNFHEYLKNRISLDLHVSDIILVFIVYKNNGHEFVGNHKV